LDTIVQIRQKIRSDVFDYQVLMDALAGYRKPRDKITRLLTNKIIIRLKKGLYCFSEAFRKEPFSREYIANLIYGPSYVSLEYALSYHGLIPERVEVVTSVTTGRSRDFDTPLGTFSYRMLKGRRYAVGAILETSGKTPFLIATPEKALTDKIWTDKRFSGLHLSDYDAYLYDDLRIDHEAFSGFDYSLLHHIANAYGSAKINNLLRFLKGLKEASYA
jgi:predicted transcriptional regulator of viral defense system